MYFLNTRGTFCCGGKFLECFLIPKLLESETVLSVIATISDIVNSFEYNLEHSSVTHFFY